ncbi:autoinducer binding domain-containing protein [Bordetella genomosp. 13]|uniref:autoinducer binding domain-containing protein n=1 Tax=Bordetella genomosp. 13 TaxID=463040 RepID=UPI0011A38A96|nr:autoinducer binding domain-containing protein [Bordetella genomosp. 13]
MSASLPMFEPLLHARTRAEVDRFLASHVEQLDYRCFFYSPLLTETPAPRFFRDPGRVRRAEQLGLESIHTSYPTPWIQRYQEARFVETDPIVKLTASSTLPLLWDGLSKEDRRHPVFDESREHGLASGITVPLAGIHGDRALFSIAGDLPPERSQRHTAAMAGLVTMTAMYLHETVRRIQLGHRAEQIPALTPREKDCLQWAAVGKTSWEIAYILNVSERTVVFHIGNACRKLGAANRRQAVARAIGLQIITP